MLILHHLLSFRQRKEMDSALANMGSMYTDEDINALAQRQFEDSQVCV